MLNFIMFWNQLISIGDFWFFVVTFWYCVYRDHLLLTCYDNLLNRQNEVRCIVGLYPFSDTILLKHAFNQFLQLGQ